MRSSVAEGAAIRKSEDTSVEELTTTDWSNATMVSVFGSNFRSITSSGPRPIGICPFTLVIVKRTDAFELGGSTLRWIESSSGKPAPESWSTGIRGTSCEKPRLAANHKQTATETSQEDEAGLREEAVREASRRGLFVWTYLS
jgi:hypothetical protein